MTRIILNGCNGKMGQTISAICKEDADAQIVAGIDLYDGIENDYAVFSSIDKCDVEADVVIDFSNANDFSNSDFWNVIFGYVDDVLKANWYFVYPGYIIAVVIQMAISILLGIGSTTLILLLIFCMFQYFLRCIILA